MPPLFLQATAITHDIDIYPFFSYFCHSYFHSALLSGVVTTKDEDQLQIPPTSEVEMIERTLNLSTPPPTVVVNSAVVSDGDVLPVAVAILPTLQTLLPSNLSG